MKTLILTEKPSVARDFAGALGVKGRRDGYLENDRYVVTWAVGHLLELMEPQDYDPKWSKWRLETLPILPEAFRYKPLKKTAKQLSIIQKLLAERRPDRIVIATDAGREGEVIARTILMASTGRGDGAISRFWTSQALTPQVIQEGMEALRPASEYERLWKAGQARQIADWLVGMNGSRAASIVMKDLFSVGRVQTAVLSLLVDRRRARETFKPEPYWVLKAKFSNAKGAWWGRWCKDERIRFDKKEEGDRIVEKIQDKEGKVLRVKKQKRKQPPPYLYSLTDLQRDANRRFGFSAKKTLNIAQDLYENQKCLSYPRTDSKVLGTKNVEMTRRIVEKLAKPYPDAFAGVRMDLIALSNKRVFNDAKLTDHHALIPLSPLPQGVKEGQQKIYDLVLKRFAAAFHPDFEYEETVVTTEVEGESFRTKGRRTLQPGWRAVAEAGGEKTEQTEEAEQEELPPLRKGDPAVVEEADLAERRTTPPPEYTEALLLGDMTNPARYVSEEELKKVFKGEVGLGTQATRAQIIETLIARLYAERKKRHLIATEKGCRLIDTLRRLERAKTLASPEETARWEMKLNRIAQGQGSDQAFLTEIKGFVEEVVREFKGGAPARIGVAPRVGLGACPACGGRVVEGKEGYGCSNWRKQDGSCRFVIGKKAAGKAIPPSAVSQLLEKGLTDELEGFVSKNGTVFSARLKLFKEDSGHLRLTFDSPQAGPRSAGLHNKTLDKRGQS